MRWKALTVKPDDIVIVRFKQGTSPQTMESLYHTARKTFPNNKIILLEKGLEIQTLDDKQLGMVGLQRKPVCVIEQNEVK